MTVQVPNWIAYILKNYKTSLVGLFAFIMTAVNGYHVEHDTQSVWMMLTDNKFQWGILLGAGMLLAKDINVTGGDAGQESTVEALHAACQAHVDDVKSLKQEVKKEV